MQQNWDFIFSLGSPKSLEFGDFCIGVQLYTDGLKLFSAKILRQKSVPIILRVTPCHWNCSILSFFQDCFLLVLVLSTTWDMSCKTFPWNVNIVNYHGFCPGYTNSRPSTMIVGIMARKSSQQSKWPSLQKQKTFAMSVVHDDGNLNEQEW